ncbi:MAG: hypothetical protein Q4G51_08630 [Dermatophilus congolensis]|nr:hypothetical protein [Dermatophilus congolensis]
MSGFVAELHKLVSLRAVRGCALAAVVVTALLTWFNGSGTRSELDEGYVSDISGPEFVGLGEVLIVVAMLAAIGVMTAGQEYRSMPEELGGGSQARTSALAEPNRLRMLATKLAALTLVGAVIAALAGAVALFVADAALGQYAPPLDLERWADGARGALYALLTGLLGMVLTVLLRSGLVPMIYLVANSTVISVGYLLTQITPLAWYLPDTSGMTLVRPPDDVHQPSPLVGGLVMTAWIVAFGVAALALERRRDA